MILFRRLHSFTCSWDWFYRVRTYRNTGTARIRYYGYCHHVPYVITELGVLFLLDGEKKRTTVPVLVVDSLYNIRINIWNVRTYVVDSEQNFVRNLKTNSAGYNIFSNKNKGNNVDYLSEKKQGYLYLRYTETICDFSEGGLISRKCRF